jgi:hypothetical protein
MLKKLKQMLTNFFSSDLRWKLIKIKKFSKINIYPHFFSRTGFKGIYRKIIIYFFLKKELKIIKKNITKEFFNYNDNKVNFLISTPSSGSNFARNLLQSYFELLYQLGNGVPKYDNVNSIFFYASSQIQPADMWNHVKILTNTINKNKFIDQKKYQDKKIIFSRYPLGRVDLYKISQFKPVIMVRNPFEQISSSYIKFDRRPVTTRLIEVNHVLLLSKMKLYEKYVDFWSKYTSKSENINNFLVIDYEDLLLRSKVIFEKILSFYDYEINDDFIEKSI